MKKSDSSRPENDKGNYGKALQRAAELCSRQEQCSSHIREKLKTWNVSPEDEEKIILKLTHEKFLDDSRYASFYVKDKFRFNGWGRIRISHNLRQKRVGESEIEKALSHISEEEWFQACFDLIKNKSAKLKEDNPFKRKGKLFRYLAGRGFEPELIYRSLDQLEKE